jgi:hypothetical protein
MNKATPDTKQPLDLVALRELANETKDLAFGAVVSRLLDRIEELEGMLRAEPTIAYAMSRTWTPEEIEQQKRIWEDRHAGRI